MSNLPEGRIRAAIGSGAKEVAFDAVPFTLVVWAIIFLVPWAHMFGSSGTPPLGISAFEKLANFGDAPFPWMSILVTLLLVGLCFAMMEGAKADQEDPAGHQLFDPLKEAGLDPIEVTAQFEASVSSGAFFDGDSLVATPQWLFDAKGLTLLPVKDIAWAYLKKSTGTDDVLIAGFQLAGVINSRQARSAPRDTYPDTLVLHAHSRTFAVDLKCGPELAQTLLEYLLQFNADIIMGWDKALKTLWKDDRTTFVERARVVQSGAPNGPAAARNGDLTLSDVVEQGEDLLDTLGD